VGIGGKVLVVVAYAIARSRFRFERPVVVMTANAGKKLMARIASLFVQFRQNDIIDTNRTVSVPDEVFALSLGVVVSNFTTVFAVDYAAQALAVFTIPLVVLVLIFQRGVVSGLTAGTVER
jgi:ABC-type glycerol-3-phosphate transport system permease component